MSSEWVDDWGVAELEELVELLDLEECSPGRFRGGSIRRSLPFVFGGQLLAQSLAAAYRLVPAPREVHSLHAYFEAAADPTIPLTFDVDVHRAGRTYTTVQVRVSQHPKEVFVLLASFRPPAAQGEAGESVEHTPHPPSIPQPQSLPHLQEWLEPHRDRLPEWWAGALPIDLRYPLEPPHVLTATGAREARQALWLRAVGRLPQVRGVHQCVLAFASDMNLLDAALLRHGLSWYTGHVRVASLDHAMWFHDTVQADRWLLVDQRSPVSARSHIFGRGEVYQDGRLVASMAQEGLIRVFPAGDGAFSRSWHQGPETP